MDSLFDILKRKDFDLPAEIIAVKKYVREEFNSEVEVILKGDKEMVIASRNASLVGSLRLHGPRIKKAADTERRLIFRVG